MIYTVTFNPALDYTVGVGDLTLGRTNRTEYEYFLPGGKGLNVSVILSELGAENVALGFVAGFVGDEIVRRFEGMGGTSGFIRLDEGLSRINVKIKSEAETEINAKGPTISHAALDELIQRIDTLGGGDTLVLAGSIPSTLPDTLYADIMERLSGKNVTIAVDAEKGLLMNVLKYQPFLIKPNHHELGDIFGVELKSRAEVILYAEKLRSMGAQNVLVSMGAGGAVLAAADGRMYQCDAPHGTVVNTVGSGDSMVAGFLAEWHRSGDYDSALKMGIAAGSASAFSHTLATKDEIEKIYNLL